MQTAELLTTVREMRTVVMKALDTARSEKAIGSSLDATVTLYISDVEFVESLDVSYLPLVLCWCVHVLSGPGLQIVQGVGVGV